MSFTNVYQIKILAFGFLLVAGVVRGEEPIILPAGGRDALSFQEDSAVDFQKANVKATAQWVDSQEMPFKKAMLNVVFY